MVASDENLHRLGGRTAGAYRNEADYTAEQRRLNLEGQRRKEFEPPEVEIAGIAKGEASRLYGFRLKNSKVLVGPDDAVLRGGHPGRTLSSAD